MSKKARIFRKFIFTHSFFRFLLVDRVTIRKDNIVLITGKRGDGKTTFSLKCIMGFNDMSKINKYYNKEINIGKDEEKCYDLIDFKSFDMEVDMAFKRNELQDLCKNNTKSFILADEAVVNAGRRNSMTRANKILHQILTINRKNFNTIFFCLPSVEDFDLSILQYVSHWVHIDDRGIGCVLLPNAKSIFGKKSWDIDKMKKIYDKFLDDNPTATSVPYWLFDNFRGQIGFGKLAGKVEERYEEIAHAKKNEQSEEDEEEIKPKKGRISDENKEIISEIAKKIIDGDIIDGEDYYKYCGDLQFKKEKLNKEIGQAMALMGDGRTPMKAIRDNKTKDEYSYEKQKDTQKVMY